MKKFSWGRVLDRLEFDFDGMVFSVVKYHPYDLNKSGPPYRVIEDMVEFCCEEMGRSSDSLLALLIEWIVYKKVGPNDYSLASGVQRALNITN